jgi:predicted transcriptional regulator
MQSSASEKYDLAESDLKSFTRSSIRTKVMLALMDKEMTAGELEKVMAIRTSTILHSIKDLMENSLVNKTAHGYALTNVGRMQALMLDELVNTIITLNNYRDFWLNHDMSGIPQELQKRIALLGQSEIMKDSPEAPLRSLEYFIQELLKTKNIFGVSPNTITGYSNTIASAVRNGANVELILTNPVLKIVISENRDLLIELLSHENFRLYRIDKEVHVAFTVTDSLLNLGLFRTDGSYDLGSDLICKGESSVKWGLSLFDYYRNDAILLNSI